MSSGVTVITGGGGFLGGHLVARLGSAGTERLRSDALTAARHADTHRRTATNDRDNAVARAMHWGASWADIGDALSVTRQTAHRRYRHTRWDPETQTAWTEPPLPI